MSLTFFGRLWPAVVFTYVTNLCRRMNLEIQPGEALKLEFVMMSLAKRATSLRSTRTCRALCCTMRRAINFSCTAGTEPFFHLLKGVFGPCMLSCLASSSFLPIPFPVFSTHEPVSHLLPLASLAAALILLVSVLLTT